MGVEILEGLRKIGLSDVSARVYLAALKLGEATGGRISAEAGVHRRNGYDALQFLSSKGLVNYRNEGKIRIYSPSGISALSVLVDEKRLIVDELQETLSEKYSRQTQEPLVQVYRGSDSFKAILEDILENAKEVCYYGAGMQATRIYLKYFFPKWDKQRAEKGIKARLLFIDKPEIRKAAEKMPLCEMRPLPQHYYSEVVWWLYGNKLVLTFWTETPVAVVMESDELARSFKNFFELVWRLAGKPSKYFTHAK